MADEVRMNAELDESVQRTYEKASDIRPVHTSRAYKGKQCEFKKWCSDKGLAFNDLTRFTVTGPKRHLFLEECVIGRDKRRKGQGRTEKIGRATVNSYVAAMVDLWRQQQRLKINNHPSPRDGAVSALLKITDYEENDRRRKNFADRGADTMLDGYTTTEQIQKNARFFWMASREPGTSLRNLLAFLLSHYALMRGESARRMELADLHSIQLENEGYTSCRALVGVMRQGKTNQVGRIEVGATMRNKCAQICPHGLLGFYLFWRWHVELEPFPDFTTSEKWYPVKLLKTGKDPTKEMSYKVHRDAIAGALDHIGLRSRAKTHVGRGSGARMADLGGASEAQIRRLGRWNNQAMEKCYLTSLPREATRTLAGFEPTRGGFFLDRATIDPPESLQQLVFPAVEEWQAKMTSGACEQSIAGGGFLELLQYLRVVLLQDAVVLQDEMPFHPIWKHPIFQSDEFRKFRGDQHEALRNVVDPTEQQLEKAMPLLKSKIDSVHHDLKTSVAGVRRQMESIDGNLADVLKILAPFSNGSALLQAKIVDGSDTATATPAVSASSTAEGLASPVVHTGIPTYKSWYSDRPRVVERMGTWTLRRFGREALGKAVRNEVV